MKSYSKKTIRLFTVAQFGIVAIFTIVILFSTIRLTEIGKILADLTNITIPEISYAATLNTQIQNLATLTTILASSQNSPAQQLARKNVENSLVQINETLLTNDSNKNFLMTQLSTLSKEISELDDLVKQRIIYQRLLNENKNLLNLEIQQLLANIRAYENISESENKLVEILLLSVKTSQQNRLHEIRQSEVMLYSLIELLRAELQSKKLNGNINLDTLESLLFASQGLVNQKVQSLRFEGRTRGRDNLVRNLISDISSNLQYQAYVVNKASIKDAHQVTQRAEQYSKVTVIAGIIALLLALSIIYFLHKRIVTRLVALSTQVSNAANSPDAKIAIAGNDEIANLAHTFSLYLERVREQECALLNMTLTDPLTSIPNRRAFESKLSETIELAIRNKWEVTVILIDVDNFKLYNDHYGHSAGDTCLRLVANELSNTLSRQTDFCGRFGGEEFVCILPNTGACGAKSTAESLRKAIEQLKIPHAPTSAYNYVTISVGAATSAFNHTSHSTKDILVLEADKALYQAKADGRNRYCFYKPS